MFGTWPSLCGQVERPPPLETKRTGVGIIGGAFRLASVHVKGMLRWVVLWAGALGFPKETEPVVVREAASRRATVDGGNCRDSDLLKVRGDCALLSPQRDTCAGPWEARETSWEREKKGPTRRCLCSYK